MVQRRIFGSKRKRVSKKRMEKISKLRIYNLYSLPNIGREYEMGETGINFNSG
jgi:hypothetical protein